MSLTFGELSIQGFRSFARGQTVALADTAGLTYVTGHNDVEPELGANGVGKSSLFEALYWCGYGKTSRNLKAGEVANWSGEEPCAVGVDFKNSKGEYKLTRTWHPNTLFLNGKAVDQNEVQQALGLSEDAFLYAIYHAQFVPQFADRAPAVQLEIFSDVLNLGVWEKATDIASAKARDLLGVLGRATVKTAEAHAALKEVDAQLDELQPKEVQWVRSHLVECRARYGVLKKQHEELRQAEAALEGKPEFVNPFARKESELVDKATAASDECYHQQKLEDEAASDLAELAKLEGNTCPTCHQELTKRSLASLRRAFEAKYNAAKRDGTLAQSYLDVFKAKLEKVRGQAKAAFQEHTAKYAKDEERVAALKEKIKESERNLLRAIDEDCPFDTTKLTERKEKLLHEWSEAMRAEAEHSEMVAACEFWAKAFREIRLSLVKEALTQFELTTNSALSALGLQEWAVQFDIEAEKKGGGVSKGFTIMVASPYNSEPVNFLAWSGGESQRLRLAITVGLSDLIQDFLGLHSNLEIFDEPTAWLSTEGISGLLAMLDDRARARNATILVADHRGLDAGFAARTIMVTKDDKGSRIE